MNQNVNQADPQNVVDKNLWMKLTAPYRTADTARSMWQIASTLGGYVALWLTTLWAVQTSTWWLYALLIVPAAGMLVRMFIFQHDCGHGSMFQSTWANDLVGTVCGAMMLTPYYEWRKAHAIHHANSGRKSARGTGDIYMMTVAEYRALSTLRRLQYRAFRNPLILFGFGPLFVFFIINRFPSAQCHAPSKGKDWLNVHLTTVLWFAAVAGIVSVIGFKTFLIVHMPANLLAAAGGIWLFYVQHQYEEGYWPKDEEWDYSLAGIKGSSYYKLPKILQYWSGNIGFHHIHHLAPKIPNYKLEQCHRENPWFHQAVTLTLWQSLGTIRLKLFDEETQRMVGFGDVDLSRVSAPVTLLEERPALENIAA